MPTRSFYSASFIAGYAVEWEAEVCRHARFSYKPSRLSALFAFGDLESCHRAAVFYGWPIEMVRTFRVAEHPLTRVAKVNMEIVSLARRAYVITSLDGEAQDELWQAYWSGSGSIQVDLPAPSLAIE